MKAKETNVSHAEKSRRRSPVGKLALCLGALALTTCALFAAFSLQGSAVACAESGCSGTYENGFCTADGTHYQAAEKNADDYYEIGNAGQLYWFAAQVNGGNETINGKLTANITDNPGTFDASGAYVPKNGEAARIWTPIGNDATSKATYLGNFDGNGKTISGLYYSGSDQCVGLFGRVGSTPSASNAVTIKNLSIVNSAFTCSMTTTPPNIGGLVGLISLSSNKAVMITGCYTDVRLTATTTIANICIGGLVGSTNVGSRNEVIVTNCCNAGAISANATTTGNIDAGGLIGSSGSGVALSDCYNTGTVTGSGNNVRIGGVAGGLYGTAKNCYNTGSVTGSGKYSEYLGGVAGSIGDGAAADNCYYLIGAASTGVGDGTDTTTVKTADEFASGAVAWLLNGEKADGVWKQNLTGDKKMSAPGFTGDAVNYDATNNTYYNTHNYVGSICADCGAECPHAYENGICAVCGVRQAATLNDNGTTDNTADDYYEIGNLGNLYWFADKVNGGDNAINAKLTADIDVTAKSDFTIGVKDHPYGGVFDGDGHALTVAISSTAEAAAPFSFAGGATFKNLTIAGTVATSAKFAGGFVGSTTGSLTFENCLSLVTINSTVDGDGTHGGFVGVVNPADGASVAMTNCGFIGAINGEQTDSCGGLFGWLNLKTTVTNSFVAATYTVNDKNGNAVARNDKNLTATNVYYLNMLNEAPNGATAISADQLTSGELTFKLGSAWKQTLGTDAYPNFSGEALYGADFDCTGKPGSYNNTAAGTVPAHDYVNGVCSSCHGNEVPTLNADGYYEIGNAGELEWFSAYVNDGHGNTNAILTADIDLSGITHTPIGVNYSDFAGVFDGKGFTIRNMKFTCVQNGYGGNLTYDYQGLFGVIVNGAVVKNFTIDGEIILAADGQKYIGGAVGLAYSGAKIENVTSYVDITDNRGVGQTGFTNIAQIGGVVGQLGNNRNTTSATAENCRYYGTINVNTAASVGGIAGQGTANSIVLNCVNYGTVGWNYIGHAGGVIGSAQLGTQVKNCVNYGSVSIIRNDCVGGVAGYANDNVRIENCANYADIDAKKSDQADEPNVYLGGILGYVNSGKFAALTGCFNYGKVTDLDNSYIYTGAIVGYINSATKANVIQNNAYLDTSCQNAYGTNSSSTQPGVTTSATAAQFASGEIAYLLNGGVTDGTQAWYQELTDTAKLDPYPVLSGKAVYYFIDCLSHPTYANAARQDGAHDYDANDICKVCGKGIIPYLAYDATTKTFKTETVEAMPVPSGDTTSLTTGWYYVNKNVTFRNGLTIAGDVNLILQDGVEMTVLSGITLDNNHTFTVYAQSQPVVEGEGELNTQSTKTGKLTIKEFKNVGIGDLYTTGGTLRIHGGVIHVSTIVGTGPAIGGDYFRYSAEQANRTIEIFGGYVHATGGRDGQGIGSSDGRAASDVTIHGGTLIAQGTSSSGIGGFGTLTVNGGYVKAIGNWDYGIGARDFTTRINGGTVVVLGDGANFAAFANAPTLGDGSYTVYAGKELSDMKLVPSPIDTTYTENLAVKIVCRSTISMDISWTEMSFTYNDGKWDPHTHSYDAAGWSTQGGTVTITNRSNIPLLANFSFTSQLDGVNGSLSKNSILLAKGATDSTTLTLSGVPGSPMKDAVIGSLSITVAGQKEGWYIKSGNKYYYRNNEPVTGWQLVDGEMYYFDPEQGGVITVGTKEIDGEIYEFDAYGVVVSGWRSSDGKWYYFDPITRKLLTGNQTIDGWEVVLASDGALITGVIEANPATSYYIQDGVIQTGLFTFGGKKYYFNQAMYRDRMVTLDGQRYYFGSDGVMLTNTKQNVIGIWYSFDENGVGTVITGWQIFDGNLYYLNSEGKVLTGEHVIDGYTCIFDKNGVFQTGWRLIDGKPYYYKDTVPQSGEQVIDGLECTLDKDGAMQTGWLIMEGEKYYYNNAIKQTGWQTINGNRYYFDENGVMQTLVVKIGEELYGFGYDGVLLTGNQTLYAENYVFDDNGVMLTGFYAVDGKVYYYRDGVMQTGWQSIDRHTYYFDPETGVSATLFETIDDKTYYFNAPSTGDPIGSYMILSSTYYIYGREYKFDANHALTTGFIEKDGKVYYYKNGVKQTGTVQITTRFAAVGNNWISTDTYVFDSSGAMTTGFVCLGDRIYWLQDGVPQTGWYNIFWQCFYKGSDDTPITGKQIIDGKEYIFTDNGVESGVLESGMITANGTTYIVENGEVRVGWVVVDGNRYYCDQTNGVVTGWYRKTLPAWGDYGEYNNSGSSRWYYYFDENGVMQTGSGIYDGYPTKLSPYGNLMYGFVKYYAVNSHTDYHWRYWVMNEDGSGQWADGWVYADDGNWYYFSSNELHIGWLTLGVNQYYLGTTGARQIGWQEIDGKWYYFDEQTGRYDSTRTDHP